MKSVFLIKTPLQLLNAIEAKHSFNLEMDDCVLIVMGDRKSQPQILALANKVNEWGHVVVLNDVALFLGDPLVSNSGGLNIEKGFKAKILSKSIFNVRRLNRISAHLKCVDYIFVGYERYIYMRHFANVMPHNKVVLLDDGVATLEIAAERKQEIVKEVKVRLVKKIKLLAKKIIQGVKDKSQKSLVFFTMYDFLVSEKDSVLKNEFKYFRSNISSLPVSDVIYFIGGPLSEVGIVKQDVYFHCLRKVKQYFPGKEIIYIAHRRESAEKLDLINSELGLKVVLFNYPIEYQLAMIGPRPKVLASFISTALDSCRIMFANELDVVSFKLDLDGSPKRKIVENVYESYIPHIGEHFNVISNY